MPQAKPYTAKDGTTSYRVRYRLDGTSTSTTFRGPKEAARKEAEAFAKMVHAIGPAAALQWQRRNDDDFIGSSMTLDTWAAEYIAGRTGVTDGTRHGYTRTWALTYGDRIGHLPLVTLTRGDIAAALNHLSEKGGRNGKGYSDKSIANAHGLLKAMLTEAVLEGHLAANPCTRIKLPRRTTHDRGEMILLSREDFASIVEAYEEMVGDGPAHYKPLLLTLAGTGIRWGEAEALEVRDINLARATMRINKAAKWDTRESQRTVGPTKTRHSDRTVTLPATVVDVLRPLVEGKKRSDRVFLAPRGGPLRHKAFWQEAWVPACEKAGLTDPRPRIHDLRHSHASWLIENNMPMLAVSRRLGHHSITVTADIYGHLSPDIQRAAADAAELVFTGPLALEA